MLAELMFTFPGICSANKVTLIRRTFNSLLQCNLADMAPNFARRLCLHYPKLGASRMLLSCKSLMRNCTGMFILLIGQQNAQQYHLAIIFYFTVVTIEYYNPEMFDVCLVQCIQTQ